MIRFITLLIPVCIYANISDIFYFKSAIRYYEDGLYKKALTEYRKISFKSDNIKYNIANTLYKLHRYNGAYKLYSDITAPALNYYRYYNMGNIMMNLKNYKKALLLYQNALKFGRDSDIEYNIKLAKHKIKNTIDIKNRHNGMRVGTNEAKELIDTNISKDRLYSAKRKNFKIKNSIVDTKINHKKSYKDKIESVGFNSKEIDEIAIDIYYKRLKNRDFKILLIPIPIKGDSGAKSIW